MLNRVVGLVASLVATLPLLAAVTGTVMNPDGVPIADARVSLYGFESDLARATRLLSDDPVAKPLASVQTDPKGAFSLASPEAPVVAVTIERQGYVPERRFVERDDEVGAVVLRRSESGSGIVRAGGKPVANALVVVMYGPFEFLTRTGEDGRYEADLRDADRLTVIHPDFAIDDVAIARSRGAARDANRQLTAGTKFTGRVVAADAKSAIGGATILVDRWPLATSGEDGTFTIAHMPSRWKSIVATKGDLIGQRTSASNEQASVIRLERAATLSGRVTSAKTKTPLAGTIVRAHQARPGASIAAASETTTTDAKGSWSMRVFPGTWTVMASHPSHDDDRAGVAVAPGRAETRDFALDPLARVSGQVIDEARKPVVAATVFGESEVSGFGPPRPRSGSTVTGPDGRFTLRFAPSTKQSQIVAKKRGLPPGKSDLIPVAAGDRKSGVVLTIPSGFEVAGKVLDAEGQPLSGVSVTASEVQQGSRAMMFFGGASGNEDDAVHSASDGTFSMRLTEAAWDFSFRRDGYAPRVVRNQKVSASEVPALEVRLAPGVDITGRVVRAGTGIEGVTVVAYSATGSTLARTGEDGSFTLEGLEPGEVNILARKPDEFVNEMRTASAPANNLLIEVRGGGRIRGRAIDKASGQAVTVFQAGIAQTRAFGGTVRTMPAQLIDFTADDGSFVLENVPAGATNLVVSAPGFAPARLNVTVEDEKTLDAGDVPLEAGIKLTGRVTGPTGSALSNVTVRPMGGMMGGPGMGGNLVTQTDERGEYVLDGLSTGDETISFTHEDYVATRKRITLKDRETRLDAQLGAGLRITGSVVNEAGAPIAEAAVEAMSSNGTYEAAQTNASGQFEIESAAPGRYRIAAHKSGYAQGVVEDFDITSGAPARIVLTAGGTIHGRVLGLSPEELAKTRVDAHGGLRNFMEARVDAQGNYRLEGAPVGTVRVYATLTGYSTGSRSTATKTVDVTAGGSHQVDLEFVRGNTVSGRITRNGRPVPNATVYFDPAGEQASGNGVADDNGYYTASGLEDGAYTVMVRDAREAMHATSYTVRGGGTFDIAWTSASIRGRVIDAATNEPLSAVTVSVRPSETSSAQAAFYGARGATTDSTGTFMIDHVAKGSYVLTATRDAYGNETRNLTVGDSSIDGLEVKLMKNDGVLLKVVDGRDGRAIRASALVFDQQGRLVHDGRGMFAGSDSMEVRLPLGPGTYSVYVVGMNYAGRNITVQSPSRPTVTLTPGGTIRVRSRHPETRRIRLYDSAGIPMWRYSSVAPFRDILPSPSSTPLENIAPGTYTLQLLGPNDVVEETRQVTVQEGGVTDVEI